MSGDAAPAEPDAQAELVAWIEAHPELQGEGSALDVALRLLDHAYDPNGTDEPSLLSAHTPTLKRAVAGGKSRRVTYTATVPVTIETTEQWGDDVSLAELEADVQRDVEELVQKLRLVMAWLRDPGDRNFPLPAKLSATIRLGRPEQVGLAVLEDKR